MAGIWLRTMPKGSVFRAHGMCREDHRSSRV
jgi:hypothetical protein